MQEKFEQSPTISYDSIDKNETKVEEKEKRIVSGLQIHLM